MEEFNPERLIKYAVIGIIVLNILYGELLCILDGGSSKISRRW